MLLDAAAELVAAGRIDDVSMESVAGRAGVSRALVYKHFDNRNDLLAALYEREAADLHLAIASQVQQATTLQGMLRALVEGALGAQAARGATFAALLATGSRAPEHRAAQRRRDAQTLRYFARQATEELGLRSVDARTALAYILSTIPAVLGQWRRAPTAARAGELADLFVTLAMGGLEALAERR